MVRTIEAQTRAKPDLAISRWFDAPRALVFRAWSSADHIKRWFSPECFSAPEATIEFRPGGVFAVCMRSPDGQDSWTRGVFDEVSPTQRLAFTADVLIDGERKFTVRTIVAFENEGGGTRMSVHQSYDVHDPAFAGAIDGASEGWRTTLDKLGREVARIRTETEGTVVHASFSLERVYDATPAKVFHALTDKDAKARWFSGGDGYEAVEREMDVRAGGRERLKGCWSSGVVSTFDAVYFDVVPNERLVYAYEMHHNERKLSVSLATIELTPVGAGTRLSLTEQGAYLDGLDDGSRKRGTAFLLDRLGASLTG